MDVRVKSDSMESVGGSKHLTVGGEKDGKKWGDFGELVYKDRRTQVKGNRVGPRTRRLVLTNRRRRQ